MKKIVIGLLSFSIIPCFTLAHDPRNERDHDRFDRDDRRSERRKDERYDRREERSHNREEFGRGQKKKYWSRRDDEMRWLDEKREHDRKFPPRSIESRPTVPNYVGPKERERGAQFKQMRAKIEEFNTLIKTITIKSDYQNNSNIQNLKTAFDAMEKFKGTMKQHFEKGEWHERREFFRNPDERKKFDENRAKFKTLHSNLDTAINAVANDTTITNDADITALIALNKRMASQQALREKEREAHENAEK